MTGFEDVGQALQALKFVNSLLQAATNVVSLDAEAIHDAEFLRELVAFGFEYARLNPTNLTVGSEGAIDAFLATLWQEAAPDSLGMRQATGKFSELFEKQDTLAKQKQVLGFEKRLLKSAGLLSWQFPAQMQDSKFLSALVELGGTYAALNPVSNSTMPSPNFFLDTLWTQPDDAATYQASDRLANLLKDFSRLEHKIDLLKLGKYLLREFEQDPEFAIQKQDPKVLYELIRMGRAYVASDLPIKSEWENDSNFSFEKLWQQEALYADNSISEDVIVNTETIIYIFDGRSDSTKGFNPFGHAAISVNGVFYNYAGPSGFYRVDEATFNRSLVLPGVKVERYWIDYTEEQERAIMNYLDWVYENGTPQPNTSAVQLATPYDFFGSYGSNPNNDNCTTLVIDAFTKYHYWK